MELIPAEQVLGPKRSVGPSCPRSPSAIRDPVKGAPHYLADEETAQRGAVTCQVRAGPFCTQIALSRSLPPLTPLHPPASAVVSVRTACLTS